MLFYKFLCISLLASLLSWIGSAQVHGQISKAELRLNQPHEKWHKLEKRISELGLHSSLKSYLSAHKYPRPRLFVDTEAGRALVEEQLKLETESKEFPITSRPILPDVTFDHEEGVALLKENLTNPIAEQSTAEDTYKAIMTQCIPDTQKLDAFKQALLESNSLGFIFNRENSIAYPASTVSSLAFQLALRGTCSAGLGNNDLSDFEALHKLISLSNGSNGAILEHSISQSLQLLFQSSIGFLIRQPNADHPSISRLFSQSLEIDNSASLNEAFKAEFMLQCEEVTAFIQGSPYPEWKFSHDTLSNVTADFTALQTFSARTELSQFVLSSVFTTNSGQARIHHTQNTPSIQSLLEVYKGSPSSRKVIEFYTYHLEEYLELSAQSEMLLDILKIANASKLYSLEHSRYPTSIQQLVPAYFSSSPTNKYSGTAYQYLQSAPNSPPTIKSTIKLPKQGVVSEELSL